MGIAKEMQIAWEKQGKPRHMDPVGRILRMLLLGGGGCGKSRIVNLVLTALFLEFWEPRGCAKAGTINMMNLRCGTAAQRALASLRVSCGAFIVDEAAQGAAALYHAVALRSSYGRAAAHELELSDYAEPSQTFGAMPIVVECGDELQLPPVPASAGLF